MNRNTENFFETMPNIEIPRSKWTRPFNHKTTFNAGDIVPMMVDTDILPGMTIKNRTSILVRMNTPKYQTMDNLYLDTFWFKCNWWTLWDHARAFFGENETGSWTQTTSYAIPKFKTDSTHVNGINDFNTYAGIPYNTQCESWNKLGVRAYIRCYNYFFRCEALQAPLTMYRTDGDTVIDGTEVTGGKLLKACRFSDYFSRALPEPQKSPTGAITSPIGTSAPVIGNGSFMNFYSGTTESTTTSIWYDSNGNVKANSNAGPANSDLKLTSDATKSGLFADLSQAVAATINAQRISWATQRVFERDAVFGTRYWQEFLRGTFGITTDAGKDILPEYLGGKRTPINIQEIIQSSETTTNSPLGFSGGYSVTSSINEDFIKSFDQHAVLLGLMVVRAEHSYQQGVARMWTRTKRLDTFHPQLSHIGNLPIYTYEIFSDGSANDKTVFGYKEAWAEYKYKNNLITGELKSSYSQSLDAYHFGDDYLTAPVLSSNWIEEPTTFIDRTLLIPSTSHNQFVADIYIEQEIAAPMPLHCMPGLVDHF